MSAATKSAAGPQTPDQLGRVGRLIRDRKIIVCCGAGGVGKTTTAAALALAGARMGRRVLVLTIDPSRRLAETLGVARNPPEPVPMPPERLAAAQIREPGSLEAWMLDPKLVSDDAVRRLVPDPIEAQKVLDNRIYQQITSMVAGMHEYTAMEALHRLVNSGRYDLVVLDTPPSRHALDFLESPGRLSRLLDGRVFKLFLPKGGGLFARATSKIVSTILAGVFGADFAGELTLFMKTFSGIFAVLGRDVAAMRTFLSQPAAAFLLVASTSPATLAEAYFFELKTKELGLPFEGYVLNRSRARALGGAKPDEEWLGADPSPEARSALTKLQAMAAAELMAAEHDADLLGDLLRRSGGKALAVPNLPQGADDMGTLLKVSEALISG